MNIIKCMCIISGYINIPVYAKPFYIYKKQSKETTKQFFSKNSNVKEIKYDESVHALHDQLRKIIGNIKNIAEIQILLEFHGLDKIIAITSDEYFIYLSYTDEAFDIKKIHSSLKDISPLTLQSILRIYDKTENIYISSVYSAQKRLQRHKNMDMPIYRTWFYSWHVSVSMQMTREGAEIFYNADRYWTFKAKFLCTFSLVLLSFALIMKISNAYYIPVKNRFKNRQ